MIGSAWTPTKKGDVRCRLLADRHYTRQSPGHPMWTRPGYNFVLHAADAKGEAVFCWWRPKWEAGQERGDKLRALECTIFRNETARQSSTLIIDAIVWLWDVKARDALHHHAPQDLLIISAVDSRATAARRSKRARPGECFRRAGFVDLPHRKGRADTWLVLDSSLFARAAVDLFDQAVAS